MTLVKAKLIPIQGGTAQKDQEIDVQFNPTSLRIATDAGTRGGRTPNSSGNQNSAPPTTTLTMDLVFDTADEGTDEAPVSVRTKTKRILALLTPPDSGGRQNRAAPPRVRFSWADIDVAGVMESATEEIDFFASDGTPLRAKLSVTLKGNALGDEVRTNAKGPGAERPGDAPPAGSGLGGDGGGGGGGANDPATASPGGIAAGLMAAASLNVAANLQASLNLNASLGVNASLGLSASLGVGASLGLGASLSASASASLTAGASLGAGASLAGGAIGGGAPAMSASVAGGPGAPRRAEQAQTAARQLASGGGLSSALNAAAQTRSERAVAQARKAFAAPATPPNATTARGAAPTGTASTARTSRTTSETTTTGARPAAPDPRGQSFGFGVPLRPRIAVERAAPARVVTRRDGPRKGCACGCACGGRCGG